MKNYEGVATRFPKTKMSVASRPSSLAGAHRDAGDTNRPVFAGPPMLRGIDRPRKGKISKLPKNLIEGKFHLSGRRPHRRCGLREHHAHLGRRSSFHLFPARQIKRMKAAHRQQAGRAILPDDLRSARIFDRRLITNTTPRVIVTSIENVRICMTWMTRFTACS